MISGGPVLIVGGLPHNTNAHQMAVGSDVHIVAKTTPAVRADGEAPADEGRSPAAPGISIFASLHRKLIVQQVTRGGKLLPVVIDGTEFRVRQGVKCVCVCLVPA